jgi:hypothetical protein
MGSGNFNTYGTAINAAELHLFQNIGFQAIAINIQTIKLWHNETVKNKVKNCRFKTGLFTFSYILII